MEIDQNLYQFATERQAEILKLAEKYNTHKKVAKKLGISRQSVSESIGAVKKKAEKQGYSPEHNMLNTVPDSFHVKGISTLYDGDGEIKSQWVKSNRDKENLKEALEIFVDEISKKIKGKSKETKINHPVGINRMCVYPLADMHIGMYAWLEETMNDYDCDIAGDLILKAMSRLVDSAPATEHCLILGLGDWFHTDTVENKTLKSGNILDVDTRWQRVFRMGVQIKKMCIEKALQKHQHVKVIIANGNHDQHTSYALSLLMNAYFENNSRVDIDLGVDPFRYHVFGKNLIGINHGMIKEAKLPGIMANDRAEDWGKTKHRTWYIGHKHHQMVKEYPGCTVEMFRTMAGKDAWSHENGFRANRDMQRIVLHKEYGEIERARVGIEMINGVQ